MQDLEADKDVPSLGDELRVGQSVHTDKLRSHGECCRRTGEHGPGVGKGPAEVCGESLVLLWRELERPVELAARVWVGRGELAERDADADGNTGDDDDTVDDHHGSTGGDTRDHGGGDTEPGVGEAETDTEDGPQREGLSQVHLFRRLLLQTVLFLVIIEIRGQREVGVPLVQELRVVGQRHRLEIRGHVV